MAESTEKPKRNGARPHLGSCGLRAPRPLRMHASVPRHGRGHLASATPPPGASASLKDTRPPFCYERDRDDCPLAPSPRGRGVGIGTTLIPPCGPAPAAPENDPARSRCTGVAQSPVLCGLAPAARLRGPAGWGRGGASVSGCTRQGRRRNPTRRLTLRGLRAKPPAPGPCDPPGGIAAPLLPPHPTPPQDRSSKTSSL